MTNSSPFPTPSSKIPAACPLPSPASERAPTTNPLFAKVRHVTLGELAFEDRGFTRGHAHIGFDDYPHDAHGRLDFPPLKLAALQTIDPGKGYPMHPHADIINVTLVLDGTLCHEDSLGNSESVGPSSVAVLSAGRGMTHAEMVQGSSPARAVVFWIEPSRKRAEPTFRQAMFDRARRKNRLVALASGRPDAPPEALPLLRDATLFAAHLEPGAVVRHRLAPSRRAYVIATDAFVNVNCRDVEAGERVLAEGPGLIEIGAHGDTEVLLFDID